MRVLSYVAVACVWFMQAVAPAAAQGRVALSFDDGPDARLTPRLLDLLKEAGITATFCLVGQRVAQHPDIVRRIYAEGHELCNHSWNHPKQLTRGNVASQIARTDAAIRAATGTTPAILRAPGGYIGAVGRCYGDRPFVGWGYWSVALRERVGGDTLDWLYRQPARIIRVATGAHPNEIVLMHDIHKTTLHAVPGVIAGLKAKGMTFVHASELWTAGCGRRQAAR